MGEIMQKIAVLGGTFNPIHNGHIHLAKQFADKLGADRVLLIPDGIPPHKHFFDLAPAGDRLKMCRLACPNKKFAVCDLEVRRGGKSFTADTLRELKLLLPDAEFYLITGEDMFLTLNDWHDPRTIYELATVCAAPRSADGWLRLREYERFLRQKGARTYLADIRYLPVSSTEIREAVKQGRAITGRVPKAVEQYIWEHHLYRE